MVPKGRASLTASLDKANASLKPVIFASSSRNAAAGSFVLKVRARDLDGHFLRYMSMRNLETGSNTGFENPGWLVHIRVRFTDRDMERGFILP
jgi:hypothetical protein